MMNLDTIEEKKSNLNLEFKNSEKNIFIFELAQSPKGLSSRCSCRVDSRSPESDICCPCSGSDTQSSGPCRLSLSKLFRSSSFL